MRGTGEIDSSMARYEKEVAAQISVMKEDPALWKLHQEACDWHREKIRKLRAREDWGAFIAELEQRALAEWTEAAGRKEAV
jgi:hypothetical protein